MATINLNVNRMVLEYIIFNMHGNPFLQPKIRQKKPSDGIILIKLDPQFSSIP